MALADTAALIASLELQDKFSSTVSKYDKAVSGMQQKSNTLDKVGFQIGRGARNTIDNVGRIAAVGAGLIASQVALGVRSLTQLTEIENQTAAVIKSTGAAANVSAEQIRAQAEALEDLTTIDDKAIQAGQNMLLTFTNIRNEAGKGNDIFNQATEAVLDLATAMGTEPKQAALQLGKALNDPVRGLTALRRVGIQFTEQQEQQITKMVEAGRTLDAQRLIIRELNKEFGGSAEAFGEGPGATMRRFGDAVEGAQQALATGFLPVMERVSKLVQDALGDPKVLANIKAFGEGLAGGVEDLIDIGSKLPWDAIGNSAKLMGQGAKALLDAFTGLPPWVQTAVLTGWGLNKLTGGALGNIAGTLAKSAFGAIRGASPATPVFTKEVGLPGGGGGAPVTGGGGSRIGGALGLAAGATVVVGGALELANAVRSVEDVEAKNGHNLLDILFQEKKGNDITSQLASSTASGWSQAQKTGYAQLNALHEMSRVTGSGLSTANRNLQEGNARQRELKAGIDASRATLNTGFSRTNANLGVSNARLATIAAKDFSANVTVNVPLTTHVSISEVQRTSSSVDFASGFNKFLLNG